MSRVRSAIHVRTGEPAAGQLVAAWLARHGIATTDFPDVYETCAYLIQQGASAPDLAWVGADGLAADEIQIVDYIRDTWLGTAIIAYATSAEAPLPADGVLTRACPSSDALRQLLADSPEELLRRLRAPPSVAGPLKPAEVQDLGIRSVLNSAELAALLDEQPD